MRLDEIPRCSVAPVISVYIGMANKFYANGVYSPIALFLLVEEVRKDEFKRIGICTRADENLQPPPPYKRVSSYLAPLEQLGLAWPKEERTVADGTPESVTGLNNPPRNTWPTLEKFIESGLLQRRKLRLV